MLMFPSLRSQQETSGPNRISKETTRINKDDSRRFIVRVLCCDNLHLIGGFPLGRDSDSISELDFLIVQFTPQSCESNWKNPSTRNRTRDHLIAAVFYSQMLCQLSYRRLVFARAVRIRLVACARDRLGKRIRGFRECAKQWHGCLRYDMLYRVCGDGVNICREVSTGNLMGTLTNAPSIAPTALGMSSHFKGGGCVPMLYAALKCNVLVPTYILRLPKTLWPSG